MSMINPYDRSQENPWDIAKRFRQSDPLASRRIGQEAAEQEGRPDTLSGTFQPVVSNIDSPMSVGEQAFQERLAEADQQANTEANTMVRLAEARRQERAQQEFDAEQAAVFGQQQQQGTSRSGYPSYTGAPQVSGDLSKSRQQVVQEASRYLGSPYQLGGRTVKGVDCSGLVMAVYNQAGYNISQHSATWQGRNIPGVRTSVSNLQPGDIVAWKDGSHIAVYAGNGMIIDASSRRGTTYRKLWAPQSAVYGIKLRFPGE